MSKDSVYHAEFNLRDIFRRANVSRTAVVAGTTVTLPDERRFGSIVTMQTYVDRVLYLVNLYGYYHVPPCHVKEGTARLQKHAYYQNNRITVPRKDNTPDDWAWREIVVLHELAHHLTPGHGHDAHFNGALTYLLTLVMGPEAGWIFRVLLDQEGQLTKEKAYV